MESLSLIVAVKVVVDLLVPYATALRQAVDPRKAQHHNHKVTLLRTPQLARRTQASLLEISEEDEVDIIHMVDKMTRLRCLMVTPEPM